MTAKHLLILASFFIFAGCSQSIDQVNITPLRPGSSNYVFAGDVEHQGGNSQDATSASAILSDPALGGNLMRTMSSSPSFQMSSGIGVD